MDSKIGGTSRVSCNGLVCSRTILFSRQVLQSIGVPVGTCLVSKSTKDDADKHVPTLFSDSTVALGNAAKPINWLSEKLKHVEIHVNFFRQYVQAGHIKCEKVDSALNKSDVLTKGFSSRESFRAAVSHFMLELPHKYRPTTTTIHETQPGTPTCAAGALGRHYTNEPTWDKVPTLTSAQELRVPGRPKDQDAKAPGRPPKGNSVTSDLQDFGDFQSAESRLSDAGKNHCVTAYKDQVTVREAVEKQPVAGSPIRLLAPEGSRRRHRRGL